MLHEFRTGTLAKHIITLLLFGRYLCLSFSRTIKLGDAIIKQPIHVCFVSVKHWFTLVMNLVKYTTLASDIK